MARMQMVAIINQKGGVGKTTTTMNLAHALAKKGNKVLAVDFDPQAHLTAGLGALQREQMGIAEVMLDEAELEEVMLCARENLYLLPAGESLANVEHLEVRGAERGFLLSHALSGHCEQMDYVLIDCPPSSGILGMNALFAVKEVIIPVSGDFFALQGISRLMVIFRHIENALDRKFDKWVVLTRFHQRRRLAMEVKDKVSSYFPKHVYQTAIRETVALAESPGFGQTIFEYQASSNGADDYMSLAEDVLMQRAM